MLDVCSVGVSLKLVFAANHIAEHRKHTTDRGIKQQKENKSRMDGNLCYTEGIKKISREAAASIGNESQKEEDNSGLHERENHALDNVFLFKVADLVSQYC